MNKITIEHLRVFWGVHLKDKDAYIEKIKARLVDYAFMYGRKLEFLEIKKIDRVFRFAIGVESASMLDLCDLKITPHRDGNLDLFSGGSA